MKAVSSTIILLSINLFESIFLTKASSLISTSLELCGTENILALTKSGDASSITVSLAPLDHRSVCKIRVTAPETHVINMQFVDTSAEIHRALIFNNTEPHPPCMMSVYLPENPRIPVWKGDPCSGNALPDVDLLTPDFRIVWNPPSDPSYTKGRRFVLTSVGQGIICKEPGQHTCMKIGWEPVLCISDHLLCDGNYNCPRSSTNSDEDDKLCRSHFLAQSTWEQLAVELYKKLNSPTDSNNKWLHDKLQKHTTTATTRRTYGNWREWTELKKLQNTTNKTEEKRTNKATDSISSVLSKYGPWGYLMLGMLICGTVLMFCGLWECCFRKPKNQIDSPLETQPPTTVLIINGPDDPPRPPNYDDLDQPPSYLTLFPNVKIIPSTSSISNNNSDSCNDSENNSEQIQTIRIDNDVSIVERNRETEVQINNTERY